MLGGYFPGQAYPGQSGGYVFGIIIKPETLTIVKTIDDASLIQNHILVVADILREHSIDPALVIGAIQGQTMTIQHTIDEVTILVMLKPKPHPPIVTLDRPSINKEIVTIEGDISQGRADIAGAYAEKPRVDVRPAAPHIAEIEP